MKLVLEKIYHNTTDKNGNPYIGKNNRPYTKCVIVADGIKYYGFGNKTTRSWHEGDEVEVEVSKNGDYMNFKTLKPKDPVIEELEGRVEYLEARLEMIEKKLDAKN